MPRQDTLETDIATARVQLISSPNILDGNGSERIKDAEDHFRSCYYLLVARARTMGIDVFELKSNGMTGFQGPREPVERLKGELTRTLNWRPC